MKKTGTRSEQNLMRSSESVKNSDKSGELNSSINRNEHTRIQSNHSERNFQFNLTPTYAPGEEFKSPNNKK